MVYVYEETENDEEPNIKVMKSIVRCMDDRLKEKKKYIPPKTSIKNTKIVKKKTPQWTHVSKNRKVKEKVIEKKSLKRKLIQSSDSEINVEEDVQEIVANVVATPLDNVSFHYETSVQKCKYVYQRRIACERELNT